MSGLGKGKILCVLLVNVCVVIGKIRVVNVVYLILCMVCVFSCFIIIKLF